MDMLHLYKQGSQIHAIANWKELSNFGDEISALVSTENDINYKAIHKHGFRKNYMNDNINKESKKVTSLLR